MSGAVYVWVLSPSLLRYAPKTYDAKVPEFEKFRTLPQMPAKDVQVLLAEHLKGFLSVYGPSPVTQR